MLARRTKIIVTLGPATTSRPMLQSIHAKGVDFVRINMSHSQIEDLERSIAATREVGLPFIIDTEGSQVRSGELSSNVAVFEENAVVRVWNRPIVGDQEQICLRPGSVVDQLEEGDLVHIDFDTLVLRVSDVSTLGIGYLSARAITGGFIGRNKAVVIDPVLRSGISLPTLSEKDYQSIEVGLRENVGHIAVSFVRNAAAVREVRRLTEGRMQIISKIECVAALEQIDEIIEESDFLLIDRGDLSKEIPVERIPFTQKIIIDKANRRGTPVFVASNLLESMIEHRKPTRAEVHDVVNTVTDGAYGLTLAAETAIGRYPLECINMLHRLAVHAESVMRDGDDARPQREIVRSLDRDDYLLHGNGASLVEPHGGTLIDRTVAGTMTESDLGGLPRLELDDRQQMEVEQIGIGTYSPLSGFMNEAEVESVLADMRLPGGTVWPIPIVLDVPAERAAHLRAGQRIALGDQHGNVLAILHLAQKFTFDRETYAGRLYGTSDSEHPGVRMTRNMNPVLLAGDIDLLRRRVSAVREYSLSPRQVRNLFLERGWITVLGFHTRNVIHRAHEFIQLSALERESCDGLFVHPVVGQKKAGDFQTSLIVRSYQEMIDNFYPKNRVVMATLSTFSRYAGPREALFTALCRKNFGCSHFVVGRDHTGVANYYAPEAAHEIFDAFGDLGIKAVKFDEVYYSKSSGGYVHSHNGTAHPAADRLSISGTEARAMLTRGEMPPEWFMRPEISRLIIDAIARGETAFVESGS
ncbi:MAG: sulfate adenylyltransferase [Chloroflexota bacterium]